MALPLAAAYPLLLLSLGLCGLRVMFFTFSYLATAGRRPWAQVARRTDRPVVTVQLPIYNEPRVAERIIEAACRLNWPADRLEVQILDDSSDETTAIVDRAAARWRARGTRVQVCRRRVRDGYKAGALASGLKTARGSLVAVFDADFVPPPDFLERTVPYLTGRIAAVQARWGHLNRDQSIVTRIQAMALDGYFVIEQTVRARLGLFVSFNGSAGVWRREAILAAGGWQGDSLAEDTDLSFRAQLAGWRVIFLPQVVIPAELPATVDAFRRQQRRWAIGTTQLLLKLGPRIMRAQLPLAVRLHAVLTLGGHLLHLLPLTCLLASPLILGQAPALPPVLCLLGVLGLAPPLMYAVALRTIYPDWRRRLADYPALALVALGLSLNGTVAVLRALLRRGGEFERTPKVGAGQPAGDWPAKALPPPNLGLADSGSSGHFAARYAGADGRRRVEPLVLGEALMAAYALSVAVLAMAHGRWGWIPLLALFAAGFGSTVLLSRSSPAAVEPRGLAPQPVAWPEGSRGRSLIRLAHRAVPAMAVAGLRARRQASSAGRTSPD